MLDAAAGRDAREGRGARAPGPGRGGSEASIALFSVVHVSVLRNKAK